MGGLARNEHKLCAQRKDVARGGRGLKSGFPGGGSRRQRRHSRVRTSSAQPAWLDNRGVSLCQRNTMGKPFFFIFSLFFFFVIPCRRTFVRSPRPGGQWAAGSLGIACLVIDFRFRFSCGMRGNRKNKQANNQ